MASVSLGTLSTAVTTLSGTTVDTVTITDEPHVYAYLIENLTGATTLYVTFGISSVTAPTAGAADTYDIPPGDSIKIAGALADTTRVLWNTMKVLGNGNTYRVSKVSEVQERYSAAQEDASGNTVVSLGTLIAGEDLTNDVHKVEQRYSYLRATAEGQVKASAGFIHTLSISALTATPTAGLLTVYDAATETGTVIYSEWVFATVVGHTITLDAPFTTACYVGFDATLANISYTVTYR